MENENEKWIVDTIVHMSGKYTPYQIFTDWITMTAISISNACRMIHDKVYYEREKRFKDIANKYSKEEFLNISNMTGALCGVLEEQGGDVLGDIYMKAGCGNKVTGQFFTPFNISYLTAATVYDSQLNHLSENEVIEVHEPSAGAGGMIIAVAQIMKERGLDYQRQLHVIAQDLDWNGVYMTYVQLSLMGIKAVVIQGDTLCDPYHSGYDEMRVLRTPAEMGMLL